MKNHRMARKPIHSGQLIQSEFFLPSTKHSTQRLATLNKPWHLPRLVFSYTNQYERLVYSGEFVHCPVSISHVDFSGVL